MRRIIYKMKRLIQKIFTAFVGIVASSIGYLIYQRPEKFYFWVVGFLAVGFFCWLAFSKKSGKYINSDGYVVLAESGDLEHRNIAQQILGRSLRYNEVVHHINGVKTDNKVENLCLMNSEKHEFFHTWLRWKKEKDRRYPSIADQKHVLENEYAGTLLEKARIKKQDKIPGSGNPGANIENMLYDKLRDLRRELSTDRGVPAYMVFDDKTLLEISKSMPATEDELLNIRGVGPARARMYGSAFISVVRKYKENSNSVKKSGSF